MRAQRRDDSHHDAGHGPPALQGPRLLLRRSHLSRLLLNSKTMDKEVNLVFVCNM